MPAHTAHPMAPIALVRRIGAAWGVALLLLLSASAASPVLHHWFHADRGVDANDNCAIILFASGVVLAATAIFATAPLAEWREIVRPQPTRVFVRPPRYLRRPERGPPSLLS